jgi:hypothetical protein
LVDGGHRDAAATAAAVGVHGSVEAIVEPPTRRRPTSTRRRPASMRRSCPRRCRQGRRRRRPGSTRRARPQSCW